MGLTTTLNERIAALPCWNISSTTDSTGARIYDSPLGPASSVTTILSASRDNTDLDRWREALGEERADAISNFAASRGIKHGKLIDKFLLDRIEPDFDFVQTAYWRSVRPFLETIETCLLIEGAIWHPEGFAGRIDNLSYLQDDGLQPTLIDWKTADAPRNAQKMYEYSLQAAAYVAGANFVYRSFDLSIERAKIVVALPAQSPQIETLNKDDLEQLFQHFLARLQRYTFAKK